MISILSALLAAIIGAVLVIKAMRVDELTCDCGNPTEEDMIHFKGEPCQPNTWVETARQHLRNEEYYRGLLNEIGRLIGPAAFMSDDGSVQDEVILAKLPKLTAELQRKLDMLSKTFNGLGLGGFGPRPYDGPPRMCLGCGGAGGSDLGGRFITCESCKGTGSPDRKLTSPRVNVKVGGTYLTTGGSLARIKSSDSGSTRYGRFFGVSDDVDCVWAADGRIWSMPGLPEDHPYGLVSEVG